MKLFIKIILQSFLLGTIYFFIHNDDSDSSAINVDFEQDLKLDFNPKLNSQLEDVLKPFVVDSILRDRNMVLNNIINPKVLDVDLEALCESMHHKPEKSANESIYHLSSYPTINFDSIRKVNEANIKAYKELFEQIDTMQISSLEPSLSNQLCEQ